MFISSRFEYNRSFVRVEMFRERMSETTFRCLFRQPEPSAKLETRAKIKKSGGCSGKILK
jgi:hypothetical protein